MKQKRPITISLPKIALAFFVAFLVSILIFRPVKINLSLLNPAISPSPTPTQTHQYIAPIINLPSPSKTSRLSLDQALWNRRIRRPYLDKPINTKQLSQLLWALQGVNTPWGDRTSPSVKSSYPLTIYVVALKVEGLKQGIYRYIPGDREIAHQLGPIKLGDFTKETLSASKLSSTTNAPIVIIVAANFSKAAKLSSSQPAESIIYLEAGAATQNLNLEVEALSLGTDATVIFDSNLTQALINLPPDEKPIYWIPVGYPKE